MLNKTYKTSIKLLCLLPGLALSTVAMANPAPIIMSYWENWATYQHFPMPGDTQGSKNKVLTEQLAAMNALAYAFFTVGNDGSIQFFDTWSDLAPNSEQDRRFCNASPNSCVNFPQNAGLGNFSAFTKTEIKHHFISVGGGGNDKAFEIAMDHPEQFVSSLKTLVEHYNIDALDIDYEPERGVPKAYIPRFIAITEQIKTALPSLIVSYAISSNSNNINRFGTDNWKKLEKNLDYISIMGYDMHGTFDRGAPYTALHSALMTEHADGSIENSLKALNKAGIPNEKVILGMPLYGRGVGGVSEDGLHQIFTAGYRGDLDSNKCSTELNANNICSGMIQYKTLVDRNARPVEVKVGNQLAGVYTYDAAKGIFISYDNHDSAAAKAEYAQKNQLAGVMFWALRFDKPVNDPQSILGAVAKVYGLTKS